MTLREYLQESGTEKYRDYFVPDLFPRNDREVDVLLVLESPHIDELRTLLPLSGDAGRRALAFLFPGPRTSDALGPLLASLHATFNPPVALLNACPVPLQVGAFRGLTPPPGLSKSDWDVLEIVRSNRASKIDDLPTARARDANHMVLTGLSSRLDAVNLSQDAIIFIAGNFVHRTWESLTLPPKHLVLPIPHPSNGWWTRTPMQPYIDNLATLEALVASLTP